jgi:hypothetical protein
MHVMESNYYFGLYNYLNVNKNRSPLKKLNLTLMLVS